jgi:hypothetical protein
MLLAISCQQIFGAPVDGSNGDCPGGLPNGAQIERGRFFYECRNGDIVPKACMNDELKRMDIGATLDKKTYRIRCNLGSDNLLSLDPIACLHQGSEHKLDEQWEDGNNFYTCKKGDNNDLKIVNSGCVDQGKRIPLNEKVTKDDFVYVCNETVNNGARMMPSACVKDGKQYNVGDSFEIGNFFFNCTRIGREKITIKAAGCLNNGKRLNDGDRYFDNDVIFECRIDNAQTEIRTVGCAQRDENGQVTERRLGCTWTEGPEPFQYEWACQQDGTSAKKIQVRCNYKQNGGVYNIEPGCYRLVDKAAFGCSNDNGKLKLQSFQGDNAEQTATAAGLRSC